MKRRIGSLWKQHAAGCTNSARLEDCACSWGGKYRHRKVTLHKWLGVDVNPRNRRDAEKALLKFVQAVDDHTYQPGHTIADRQDVASGDLTLAAYVKHHYLPRHVKKHKLDDAPTLSALNGIVDGLGAHTLAALLKAPQIIEAWLDAQTWRGKPWADKTWNNRHAMLHTLFEKATIWRVGDGEPIIPRNPMKEIDVRRGATTPQHFKNRILDERVEAQLFACLDQLDQPRAPTTAKIGEKQVAQIRKAVAGGALQKVVAARFKISRASCSQIVNGRTWNPARRVPRTKGKEMRTRLIFAFDGGVRSGEMMLVQIKHVDWTLRSFTTKDGAKVPYYAINLPAEITKSGEAETIYAATPRFREMLDRRRFYLRRRNAAGKMEPDPEAYICGTLDGRRQTDFDTVWHRLFTLADLRFGRNVGLVWHTIRHEFISRIAELTKDPLLTQEIARHADLSTTQLYMTSRTEARIAAVAGLAR